MGPCCTQYNKQYKSIVYFFFFSLSALGLIHFFEKTKWMIPKQIFGFGSYHACFLRACMIRVFLGARAASRCVWSGNWAVRGKKEADTLLLLLYCQK
jgi:hypothetical protein